MFLKHTILGAALLAATSVSALAEMSEITIARQPSIGHLPLMIMQERGLLEARAAALGVEGLKANYLTFAGGSNMNDALLSGSIQFAAGGVPPLLLLWSRTQGTAMEIKGVAAMNSMPLLMNTNDPSIKTIADFTTNHKIALPSVKVSVQAIVLQMAAEQLYGEGEHGRLDPLTVSMSHPDGLAALLSKQEITAHFTASPAQDIALQKEGISTVLNSYDVLGGPATFNVVWAAGRFREENPMIYKAFNEALDEAIDLINTDREAATDIYMKHATDSGDRALIEKILADPQVIFTTTPQAIDKYLDFMKRVGTLKTNDSAWQDVFFAR
ncbi:ABC transporter substrate-binding protein [Paraburkholderia aspalathi]|nr:ABC transporter substrate-binding protein [Paraburkholderia aspalathi]